MTDEHRNTDRQKQRDEQRQTGSGTEMKSPIPTICFSQDKRTETDLGTPSRRPLGRKENRRREEKKEGEKERKGEREARTPPSAVKWRGRQDGGVKGQSVALMLPPAPLLGFERHRTRFFPTVATAARAFVKRHR